MHKGKKNIWELFFLKSLHVLGSSFTCFSIRSTVACTVFLKPKSSLGHQTTRPQKITDLCDPGVRTCVSARFGSQRNFRHQAWIKGLDGLGPDSCWLHCDP